MEVHPDRPMETRRACYDTAVENYVPPTSSSRDCRTCPGKIYFTEKRANVREPFHRSARRAIQGAAPQQAQAIEYIKKELKRKKKRLKFLVFMTRGSRLLCFLFPFFLSLKHDAHLKPPIGKYPGPVPRRAVGAGVCSEAFECPQCFCRGRPVFSVQAEAALQQRFEQGCACSRLGHLCC